MRFDKFHPRVYDPWVSAAEAQHEYGITPVKEPAVESYDGVVIAVGHNQFKEFGVEKIRRFGKTEHVLYDLKYLLPAEESDLRL